ncbi:MAG: hypothetical protein HC821_02925 [Lewinella sp.]|nr:hypothetical protein [Lewinella sp.]
MLGVAERSNRARVSQLLRDPEVARLFPRNLAFRWARDPLPAAEGSTDEFYELYLIKTLNNGEARLNGEYITKASSQPDPNGQIAVNLSMNSEGGRIWSRWTAEALPTKTAK